ncbi:MAG TPA: histidine kinase [Puia sp.]
MSGLHDKKNWKYLIIEIIFFVFLIYITSFISDLEYGYYEKNNIWNFVSALEYRAVYGTSSFILYAAYYWLFLKQYVFSRRVIPIVLSILLFIPLVHFYDTYAVNWLVSKMGFVSDKLRARALKDLSRAHLYFAINYLLIGCVVPIVGFAFLIRSLNQDEQMKALKEQQLLSELTYLKAQLHPHFFFNTINNIYSLALKQSADTAPMVARLGEMMRYILYEADHKTVLLAREIEFLSNYIAVEKMRQPVNNTIQFDVQGITDDVHIEPLLLLPFVENAFKHGLEQETSSGFINIVVCLTENELILEVVNSKPAMANNPVKRGIGLQNVIKRLTILYNNKHRLEINDQANQHQVSLTLETT